MGKVDDLLEILHQLPIQKQLFFTDYFWAAGKKEMIYVDKRGGSLVSLNHVYIA